MKNFLIKILSYITQPILPVIRESELRIKEENLKNIANLSKLIIELRQYDTKHDISLETRAFLMKLNINPNEIDKK